MSTPYRCRPKDPRDGKLEAAVREALGLQKGCFEVDIETADEEYISGDSEGYPFIAIYVDKLTALECCCQHRHTFKELALSFVPEMTEVGIAYFPKRRNPLHWNYPVLSIAPDGQLSFGTGNPRMLAIGLLVEAGLNLQDKKDFDVPRYKSLDVDLEGTVLKAAGTGTACNAVARTLERLRQLLQGLKCLPGLSALERLELNAAGETQSFALR